MRSVGTNITALNSVLMIHKCLTLNSPLGVSDVFEDNKAFLRKMLQKTVPGILVKISKRDKQIKTFNLLSCISFS